MEKMRVTPSERHPGITQFEEFQFECEIWLSECQQRPPIFCSYGHKQIANGFEVAHKGHVLDIVYICDHCKYEWETSYDR